MATRIISEGGRYRLAKDIVIKAGTELKLEPPHTREFYTPHVSLALEIKGHASHVDVVIDVEDGIKSGILEDITDEPAAA